MEKRNGKIDLVQGEVPLTTEEIFFVMKALDLYSYYLMTQGADEELRVVEKIAHKFINGAPKMELDS